METITIERASTQKEQVTFDLPYYAKANPFKLLNYTEYYAITSAKGNLYVSNSDKTTMIRTYVPASELCPVHTRISEDEFSEAFDKAISAINAKRAAACPNHL